MQMSESHKIAISNALKGKWAKRLHKREYMRVWMWNKNHPQAKKELPTFNRKSNREIPYADTGLPFRYENGKIKVIDIDKVPDNKFMPYKTTKLLDKISLELARLPKGKALQVSVNDCSRIKFYKTELAKRGFKNIGVVGRHSPLWKRGKSHSSKYGEIYIWRDSDKPADKGYNSLKTNSIDKNRSVYNKKYALSYNLYGKTWEKLSPSEKVEYNKVLNAVEVSYGAKFGQLSKRRKMEALKMYVGKNTK